MRPRRVRHERAFDEALRELPRELQLATIAAVGDFIDRSREHALRPERKSGLKGIWDVPSHLRGARVLRPGNG